MNFLRPQRAHGVFKPVGHVIVSFGSTDEQDAARQALLRDGFTPDDVTVYSSAAMKERAEEDIAHAGMLASLGQELNLVKALRDRARQGDSFLVVFAPKDAQAKRVALIAQRFHAHRAQHFGRLVIEELIPVGSGEKQVAESPDRGLDAGTRSGVEGQPEA